MASNLNQADLCIKNVRVFNSYFRHFVKADVYIKDGYTMLPLRTFMKAAMAEWARMEWDGKTEMAILFLRESLFQFQKNII